MLGCGSSGSPRDKQTRSLSRDELEKALKQGLQAALETISETVRAELRKELQQAVGDMREISETVRADLRRPPQATQQVTTTRKQKSAIECPQLLKECDRMKLDFDEDEEDEDSQTLQSVDVRSICINDVVQQTSFREFNRTTSGQYSRDDSPRCSQEEDGYVSIGSDQVADRRDLVRRGGARIDGDGRQSFKLMESAAMKAARKFGIGGESQGNACAGSWETFVKHRMFEQIVGVLVMLNTLAVGFETNLAALNDGILPEPWRDLLGSMEWLFCVLFVSEWCLRVSLERQQFFCGEAWGRNVFDTTIIGLQVLDVMMSISNIAETEWTRLIRATRILRIVRLLHLYKELKYMVYSIIESLSSLLTTITLLVLLIYTSSVLLMQILLQWSKNTHEVTYWFGDVPRTALTLLEAIAGGVSWDEPCAALFRDSGPIAGFAFLFYVCFGVFVILNVIMGVFIDKAIKVAEEQKMLDVACAISGAFMTEALHGEEITREVFDQKLMEPELMACFETLNIDMSQASVLFDLIDVDSSGCVDGNEIVEGCLRLKGTAKALDVSIMEKQLHDLVDVIEGNHFVHDKHMTKVGKHLKAQFDMQKELLNHAERTSVQSIQMQPVQSQFGESEASVAMGHRATN